MKDYNIEIAEKLRLSVNVKADSAEEAIEKIERAYYDEEYILDASHFAGVDFSIDYGLENEQKVLNSPMPLVYICSPLRGDYEDNMQKARTYCRSAAEMGVVPVAPHLLFPQFLDDAMAEERSLGLHMGLELLGRCNELWVCTGQISEGMNGEIEAARQMRIPIRRFYAEQKELSQPLYQYAVSNAMKGVVNQPLPSVMNY